MTERKFSSFLENFLKDRNLTVSTLASQMKISNKNVIMRILNDKATVNTIKSFAEKLNKYFTLTEEEQRSVDAALNHEQLPDSIVASRRILSSLFSKLPEVQPKRLKCTLKNTSECVDDLYLFDDIHTIMNSDSDDEYEIFIESVNTLAFTRAIHSLLHDGKKRKIKVYQYFSDTDDATENIHQLFTLISLSRYTDYYPYVISPKILHSNRVNIINRTKNKAYLFDVYSTDHYTSLEMDIKGTNFSTHIMKQFDILTRLSIPLRDGYISPIESLPDYLEFMSKLDSFVTFEMKSSPCFGMLPFEIQDKLYAESGYFGLGFENPAVQKMYNIMKNREKALYAPNGVHKNLVFDRKGILNFISTGRTSDHVPVFRSLTRDECYLALSRLVENENASIYILKDDYCINYIECVLFEGNSLVLFDPSLGYWDNYSEVSIKNKKMLRIMRDFINEEIIKNCCYTIEESKKIMQSLIEN